MADTEGYGLVTWNAHEPEKFHRTESIYMKPTDTTFTIVGKSFTLYDGILGMTLIKKGKYSFIDNKIVSIFKTFKRLSNASNFLFS